MNKEHARRVYFQQIKRSVGIAAVLERYGIFSELKQVGSQLKGRCPLHRGSNDRQFVVDLNKGVFRCFAPKCDRGGDVITLVSQLEHVGVREAALLLVEWYAIGQERR